MQTPGISIFTVWMAPAYIKNSEILEQTSASYAILYLMILGGDLPRDVRTVSEAFA